MEVLLSQRLKDILWREKDSEKRAELIHKFATDTNISSEVYMNVCEYYLQLLVTD